MNRSVRFFLGLVFVVLSVAGCKTNVSTDIYLTDVYKVMANKKPVSSPIEIAFEVPGKQYCQKAEEGLMVPMAKAWSSADFIGCEEVGFNTMARFRAGSEIVFEEENKKSDSAFPIYVGIFEEDGRIIIAYFINREAMNAFDASIPEDIRNRRSGEQDLVLTATFNNDGDLPVTVRVSNVFVDGKPVQNSRDVDLVRRMKAFVQLSDVSNAAIAQGLGYSAIASVPIK